MVIRNKEVINICNKIGLFLNLQIGINYKEYLDLLLNYKNIINEIKELDTFGIKYMYIIKYFLFNKKVSIFTEEYDSDLTKILNDEEIKKVCEFERNLHNYSVLEEFENTKKILIKELKNNDLVEIDLDILETNEDFLKRYPLTIEVVMHKESIEIIKKAFKRKQLIKIKDMYSRPKIRLENTNFLQVKINPNLPKDELIAYISKIKDEYDKDNSLIKTPLELLGEDFEKSDNKKINKKIIADKFFIYDYVTSRQEQIKKDNEFLYEVYEEDIQKIKKNPYITSSDRKIQLKEKKRELEENANTRKDELFADIPKFKTGTAKRYYYDIKPFIDDCKYKELITGMKL